MRAIVVGVGAVGARAARQLLALGPIDDLAVIDPDTSRREAVVASLGRPVSVGSDLESVLTTVRGPSTAVLLTCPTGDHRRLAELALVAGASVVSVSDSADDVAQLLELDDVARAQGLSVVAGAGFSPGLSCVLAAYAARSFEKVDEIHVARVGVGGPACAHQRQAASRGRAQEWAEGAWVSPRPGSGRLLCWFPDPVGGLDCYRGAFAEPLLLAPAFPGVHRVTARYGARRFDRLTARLPMLARPSPEGPLGALRVEVAGTQGLTRDARVVGAIDRPAVAAGTVAALAARWAVDGRFSRRGAAGLASLVEPGPFLAVLAERGVKAAVFEGAAA
ncbi:MAG TPA: Gfo/Idh/MocA family oxidoreductase [Acidimicrobiales bacterium]|nr:Gfo/Idh/MocA family oxidoreductase [Acidimicrobiales bacterium]